jgi:hypothetical protein
VKNRFKLAAAIALLAISFSNSPAHAQEKLGACSQAEKINVKNHITKQINALGHSNWKSAYSYAAFSFQKTVPLYYFESIIKSQYPYLMANDGFTFGGCRNTPNGINQFVNISYQGAKLILLYGLTVEGKRLGIIGASEAKTPNGVAA